MTLKEFLELTDGEVITHVQAQTLNKNLAKVNISNLSKKEQSKIANYLDSALLMNSVVLEIKPSLELLLESLRDV